jgi:hypothetical protein
VVISKCELGHPDEASRLLESVFTTIETGWGEREVLRALVAAAHVLEAAGEPQLAARAIGRASPFQDNFVDTIGNVRARLTENLGAGLTESLITEGTDSGLPQLITEVRAALATLTAAARPS